MSIETNPSISILPVQEQAVHPLGLEHLLDDAFGPNRYAKTVYRLRGAASAFTQLSLAAWDQGRLVGSIQFWPLSLRPSCDGEDFNPLDMLLLGPLAVDPACQGTGLGQAMLQAGCARADQLFPQRSILLVGDYGFYRRAGFQPTWPRQWVMPGPFDPDRLLIRPAKNGQHLPHRAMITGAAGGSNGSLATMSNPSGQPVIALRATAAAEGFG